MKNFINYPFKKISEGFWHYIGTFLAITAGSLVGSYCGSQNGSKTVVEELSKRDSVFIENKVINLSKAKEFENAGFQALLEKDIDEAIICFLNSENNYNSYHASYEITLYLRKNKQFVSEPDFWKKTYKYVIDNFGIFIPSDYRIKMEESL